MKTFVMLIVMSVVLLALVRLIGEAIAAAFFGDA